jgi:neutral ceramidase
MKTARFKIMNLFICLTLGIFLIACGNSSGGSDSDSDDDDAPMITCVSVSGRLYTDEAVSSDCAWEDHEEKQIYVIAQDNCELAITTNATEFSGTVEESDVSWTGEYPYEDGTMTVSSMDLSISGDTVTGAAVWSWDDGDTSCSGTTQISGTFEAAAEDTIPQSPSDLSVRSITSRLANLSWTDNADNETGFIIERSEVSESDGFEEMTRVAANDRAYDDPGLAPSTQYWYRIRAVNSAGSSDYSNVEDVETSAPPAPVPLAPSDFIAEATSSASVSLTWTDQSTHEDGFSIERLNATALSDFEEIATVAFDEVSFEDVKLAASTKYIYRIRAYNSAGYSGYSNSEDVTTLDPPITIPLRPTDLVVDAVTDTTVNLVWTDQSGDEDEFILERSSVSETSDFREIAYLGAGVVSYQDTGLDYETPYWYRVCAGNRAGSSSYSNTVNATTEAFDPACDEPGNCQYLIGTGVYDITGPAAELGMMGYSDIQQRTAGIHTRLYSRAFIIGDVDGYDSVVFVTADIMSMSNAVRKGVMEKLHATYGGEYTNHNVMLAGTHTHSGPGGYYGYALYDFAIMGFDRQNYNAIVEGIYQSIVRAHNNLKPGKIKINQGNVEEEVGFNRSLEAYEQNPDAGDYSDSTDKQMVLLRMEDLDEAEMGMLNWFALHPTNIGKTNRLISSDNFGYASFYFESGKGTDYLAADTFVGAFAQSNPGDTSPNLWGHPDGVHDYERMEIIGTRLLNRATELYDAADDHLYGSIDYRHIFIDLSEDGSLVQNGDACVAAYGLSSIGGSKEDGIGLDVVHEGIQFGINWPAFTLVPELQDCHAEKVIFLPTGLFKPHPWTPDILPLQILKVGNLAIIGLPVEASTMSGRRIRKAVQAMLDDIGVDTVVFAGYANEYASYVTTAEEYALQHYEGSSTLFGPNTEAMYRNELVKLAQTMRDGVPAPAGATQADVRPYTISFILPVLFDDKPLFKSFGTVHQNADAAYARGDTVSVTFWGGHPKNDLRIQDTFLEVQRRHDSSWITVARDNHPRTRYRWRRNFIAYSLVTCEWDIPMDTEPGEYRIVHYGNWKNGWTRAISPYTGQSRVFTVN